MNLNNNEKKVGVITMHRIINYGSFLQTYATQTIIENLGHKCEIIDYKFPNDWHYTNGLENKSTFKSNLSRIVYPLRLTKSHRKMSNIRLAIGKYLNLSSCYQSRKEIKLNPPIYDTYVTGSDQTWNPKHTVGDPTFLLDFAPISARKISFSASLAGNKIDTKYLSVFKQELCKYQNISVRDANGKKLIHDISGKDSIVTLDPTLILNKEQWSSFGRNRRNKYSDKSYIVFYLITHSFDPTPYIYELLKELQQTTGYKVYSFTKIPEEFNINYEDCADIHVEEFIQLYENAKYVVTSSFHGTAFAVNFGVPLYSVIDDKNQSDDRQSSLLKALGIENCIVGKGTKFENIYPNYVVSMQQQKLNELRERSIVYLKNSL